MKQHMPSQALADVFFGLCKVIDSPVSLGCWLRFKHGEFRQLVEKTVDPRDYLTAAAFGDDYLCTSYLSKNTELVTGIDLKGAALAKFIASESALKVVNRRFRFGSPHGARDPFLFKVARKIADILGPVPDLRLLECRMRWGPGATVDVPRRDASSAQKHTVTPSVTYRCLPVARAIVANDYHWFEAVTGIRPDGPFTPVDSFFRIVPGNKVVTVPKNAKTDRTIAIEPTMNSFVQQGIGRWIRRRLKAFGVDLDNQEINKGWASLAHDLDLCTVDLSAASDSIAKNFVAEVLPPDWFSLLHAARSDAYSIDGAPAEFYEKFSSMGNAYTFELESLLFYAILVSTCELEGYSTWGCSVYGDDIVAPAAVAPALIANLSYCGFQTNKDKTFVSGRFFESCGGHYFGGIDVTPAYQKKPLVGPELVRAHNRIVRCSLRFGLGVGVDRRLWSVCLAVRRLSSTYRCKRSGKRLVDCSIPANAESDDGFLRFAFEREVPGAFTPGLGYHCSVFRLKKIKASRPQFGSLASAMRDGMDREEPLWRSLDPQLALLFGPLRVSVSSPPSVEVDAVRFGFRRWIIPSGCYYADLI